MNAPDDETAPRHTTAILAMHYSTTGLAWVQDAYTLVFGGLMLLGARAGDLLGHGHGLLQPAREDPAP